MNERPWWLVDSDSRGVQYDRRTGEVAPYPDPDEAEPEPRPIPPNDPLSLWEARVTGG